MAIKIMHTKNLRTLSTPAFLGFGSLLCNLNHISTLTCPHMQRCVRWVTDCTHSVSIMAAARDESGRARLIGRAPARQRSSGERCQPGSEGSPPVVQDHIMETPEVEPGTQEPFACVSQRAVTWRRAESRSCSAPVPVYTTLPSRLTIAMNEVLGTE